MEEKQTDEIDLLKLFEVLLSKLWLLILVAVLFGVGAFGYTKYFVQPKYESTSKLYVYNKSDNNTGIVSSSDLSTSKSLVSTYIQILNSDLVLDQVVAQISEYQGVDGFDFLGTEPYTTEKLTKMLKAGSINNTEVFGVTVTANDPYEAKFINDAIIYYLPEVIKSVVKAGDVSVIEKGKIASEPSSPSILKNTVLGGLLGGVLAAAIVVVMALLDNVIHSEEDLTAEFPNIPIIGVLADMKDDAGKPLPQKSERKRPVEAKEKKVKEKKKWDDDDEDYEDEE